MSNDPLRQFVELLAQFDSAIVSDVYNHDSQKSPAAREALLLWAKTMIEAYEEISSKSFPHMCRNDHQEIGYHEVDNDERCPLCQIRDVLELLHENDRNKDFFVDGRWIPLKYLRG